MRLKCSIIQVQEKPVPNIWALVYQDKLNPTHQESSFYGLGLRGFYSPFAVLLLNSKVIKKATTYTHAYFCRRSVKKLLHAKMNVSSKITKPDHHQQQ